MVIVTELLLSYSLFPGASPTLSYNAQIMLLVICMRKLPEKYLQGRAILRTVYKYTMLYFAIYGMCAKAFFLYLKYISMSKLHVINNELTFLGCSVIRNKTVMV